eukprot:7485045-Pyramimonas_sp.AAC.2
MLRIMAQVDAGNGTAIMDVMQSYAVVAFDANGDGFTVRSLSHFCRHVCFTCRSAFPKTGFGAMDGLARSVALPTTAFDPTRAPLSSACA